MYLLWAADTTVNLVHSRGQLYGTSLLEGGVCIHSPHGGLWGWPPTLHCFRQCEHQTSFSPDSKCAWSRASLASICRGSRCGTWTTSNILGIAKFVSKGTCSFSSHQLERLCLYAPMLTLDVTFPLRWVGILFQSAFFCLSSRMSSFPPIYWPLRIPPL